MDFKQVPLQLSSLLSDFESSIIKINKDYQREFVWNDVNMKGELVRSVLNKYPIGAIMRRVEAGDEENPFGYSEIIDGQQRVKTLLSFKKGEFYLTGEITKKIFETNSQLFKYNRLDKKANKIIEMKITDDWKKIYFKDLPEFLIRKFNEYTMTIIDISQTNTDEVRDYFRVVQNQEKLKAGEIINAFPNSPINELFSKDDMELIAKKLNFNNNRMDILKNINMVVLLKKNKLRMGSPDKIILNSVSEYMNDDLIDDEINEMLLDFKTDIIKMHLKNYKYQLTVGGLKLILLTYFYSFIQLRQYDIFFRRDIVEKITNLVGHFNSKDIHKRETIPSEISNDIHNIWQLLKTTHGDKQVQKIMDENVVNVFKFYAKNK